MENKKGVSFVSENTLKMILLVVLIIVAIVAFSQLGWDFFRNLPDFEETEYGKKLITDQSAIPQIEKSKWEDGRTYPSVRVIYKFDSFFDLRGDLSDFFTFRWNPNERTIQIAVTTKEGGGFFKQLNSADRYVSKEWLVSPDLLDGFRNQKGIHSYQKSDILKIMEAEDEEGMIKKISELVNKRDEAYVDFPYDNWVWEESSGLGQESKMSAEEIKLRLMMLNQDYYKEDIKKALEEGKEFRSMKFNIYFDNDLAVIRWNFKTQRTELTLKPDGKMLEKEDIWITSEEEMTQLLEKKGKLNNIKSQDRRLIGDLLNVNSPSQLADRTLKALGSDKNIYTKFMKGIEEEKKCDEDKCSMSIEEVKFIMYGCETCNPDEFFKLGGENEII